jgi:hypothetical protein
MRAPFVNVIVTMCRHWPLGVVVEKEDGSIRIHHGGRILSARAFRNEGLQERT